MDLSAFKAYDIRGKYPEEVNEGLAFLVGRAVARYFSASTLIVGRDMRLSSPSLSEKLIEGINFEGTDVVNMGVCTTPMLNFAVASFGFDGGIMISASHNPGGDNAFKVVDRNVIQLSDFDGLNEIKKLIEGGLGEGRGVKGMASAANVRDRYLAHISEVIGAVNPIKVVADYGNGVGAITASPAFLQLGLEIKELYAQPDGTFPNHPANPHDIQNFDDLIRTVKKEHADLGVFFDGDADRSIMIDDKGRIVPVDLLTVLLAKQEIVHGQSGKVLYDLRFSKAVPDLLRQVGIVPVMMRVGNPYYKKALRESGGILGAEFSGHMMFSDNYYIDDGLFAALKTVKLISETGKRLSKLIDSVTIYEALPEESMHTINPEAVLGEIIAAFPEAKQIELDGVYLDFSDGFISARQSNSEFGVIRFRVEAKNRHILESRLKTIRNIVAHG